MATITPDNTLFGARGVSDPCEFGDHSGYVRDFDIEKIVAGGVTLGTSAYYALMPVPANMKVDSISLVQHTAANAANAIALWAASKDPSASGAAADVSLTPSTTGGAVQTTTTWTTKSTADMLCLKFATAAPTKGKFSVVVRGHMTNDVDSLATTVCPPWRAKLQTTDNVSGGQLDPRENTSGGTIDSSTGTIS